MAVLHDRVGQKNAHRYISTDEEGHKYQVRPRLGNQPRETRREQDEPLPFRNEITQIDIEVRGEQVQDEEGTKGPEEYPRYVADGGGSTWRIEPSRP